MTSQIKKTKSEDTYSQTIVLISFPVDVDLLNADYF